MKDLIFRLAAATRRLPVELYIGAAVFMLMLWRFGSAWSGSPMIMGDWPGHETATLEMAKCLQSGHWDCLVGSQFGGMPLFQMYAPLFFMVSAGLWLLTAKTVSVFLIMRGLVFLGLFAVAPALWYFTRTYFGREAARWALVLSSLFIFYPSALAFFGLGAGGAFQIGLVPSTFGAPLVLVLLASLKEAATEPRCGRGWWLVVASSAALALVHTMSFVFGVVLATLVFLALVVTHQRISRLIYAAAAAFGLVAFWLIPFAVYSRITPGIAIVDLPVTAWWSAVYPSNVVLGSPLVIFAIATAVVGLWQAVRQKAWPFLALMVGAWTLFLYRHGINHALPSLALHYFRFGAFLQLFGLAASGAGLAWLWTKVRSYQARAGLYLIIGAAVFVLMAVFLYDAEFNAGNGEKRVFDNKITWQIEDAPGAAIASDISKTLASASATGRIFVEAPEFVSQFLFESTHYLAFRLFADLGLAEGTGLYVQDSTMAPYFYAAVGELTSGHVALWAGEYIRSLKAFRNQDLGKHLGRIADLGMTHIVLISPDKVEAIRATGLEDEVASTPEYAIFRAKDARPLVSPASHRPLLFAAAYGHLKYRELAMALYAGADTYADLVVEETRPVTSWPADAKQRFGGIIIDADGVEGSTMASVRALGLPVIALNDGGTDAENFYAVKHFEPMTAGTYLGERLWPDGWEKLWQGVTEAVRKASLADSLVTLTRDDGRHLIFTTDGAAPVVINYSYFPSWQAVSGADRVYRVTPDRLLVFPSAAGTVTLSYGDTLLQRLSLALTAVTILVLAVLAWWTRRRPRT